jgi:hypothetical protein
LADPNHGRRRSAMHALLFCMMSTLFGAAPSPPSYEVVRWAPVIERELSASPIPAHGLTTAEVLALIDLESDGDRLAHRPRSQYRGLLQIGHLSAREAHRWGERYAWSGDLAEAITAPTGAPHPVAFDGDGARSIRAWLVLYWAYRWLHRHDPVLKALFWKGGPGTLRGYRTRYGVKGEGREVADRWLDSRHDRGIPDGVRYVRRFEQLRGMYQRWVDEVNARRAMCGARLADPHDHAVLTPLGGVHLF